MIVKNDKDLFLRQAPYRLLPMPLPEGTTIDFTNVTGETKNVLINTAGTALINSDTATTAANTATSAANTATSTANTATTTANTANNTASSAITIANQALLEAQSANNNTADIASDNKMTLDEKSSMKGIWDAIYKERSGILVMATNLGVSSATYQNKYTTLYNYLQPILGLNASNTAFTNGTSTTAIIGQTLRNNVSEYFNERQKIMNSSSIKAATTANWSSVNNDGGKPQNGADKTSLNTAQGITGQGSLATRNNVTGAQISVPALNSSGNLNANAVNANSISTSAMNSIVANIGTLTVGDIIGTNNIDITGRAVFNGSSYSSGYSAAVVANDSKNSQVGGIFIKGNSSAIGMIIYGDLIVLQGTISCGGISLMTVEGAVNAQTASNALRFGNSTPTNFCKKIVTQAGTANASGEGFTFSIAGSLAGTYRTTGNSNGFNITDVSDRRLKKYIRKEVLGLKFINKLIPRTYRMKAGDSVLRHHGFVADEVGSLFDNKTNIDSLYTKNGDYYGVGVVALVSPVVKALQETTKIANVAKGKYAKLLKKVGDMARSAIVMRSDIKAMKEDIKKLQDAQNG